MIRRFSQAETPKPRLEELQKAFTLISEVQLPNGDYKQVLITPRGRLIRIMDATKTKVLNQDARSYPVTVAKVTNAEADLWEGPDYHERMKAKQIQESQRTRLEEMRKTIQPKMLSEKQMGDKKWYQVWEGPMGKTIKILSPDKKNIVQQYQPSNAALKNRIKKAQIQDLSVLSLSELAAMIKNDWKNVYFGAVPYLEAMSTLNSIKDKYFEDSGSSIVAYLLANATGWKGDIARAVKKELNKRLKGSYR